MCYLRNLVGDIPYKPSRTPHLQHTVSCRGWSGGYLGRIAGLRAENLRGLLHISDDPTSHTAYSYSMCFQSGSLSQTLFPTRACSGLFSCRGRSTNKSDTGELSVGPKARQINGAAATLFACDWCRVLRNGTGFVPEFALMSHASPHLLLL